MLSIILYLNKSTLLYKVNLMIERRIFNPDLAKIYLDQMFKGFDDTKIISGSITTQKLINEKGAMFGVLVCSDRDNNRVVLKAFSSQLYSKYCIEGFVPPALDVEKFDIIVEKYDSKIKELTTLLEFSKDKSLIDRRKQLSNQSLSEIQDLYEFHSCDNTIVKLSDIKKHQFVPTGTGECCAPKLLNFAYKNSLLPISLAEGFYGKSTDTRVHLKYYPPCEEKCGIILPYILKLDILYVDEYICVINKQPNITTIAGKKIELKDCITSRFKRLFPSSIEQSSTHRLDMDTSGLLILAIDKESHRNISIQFQNREVKKQYIALLRGVVEQEEGIIDFPIRLDVDNRPYQIVDFEKGKKAITHYKRLSVEKNRENNAIVTRILFTPETGRTHQLRVHSKQKLFPIVGDRLYGERKKDENRMALHASYICFKHPRTDKIMEFNSPAPF